MIARKTFQLTPLRPVARPVPVTDDVTTCVVETGQAQQRRHLDDQRPPHLCTEAVHGVQVGDLLADSADQPEGAYGEVGADGHRRSAQKDHPHREAVRRHVVLHPQTLTRGEEDDDDTHHLGGVVGPVAERHPAGRDHLHMAVERVGLVDVQPDAPEHHAADGHEEEAGGDAQEGRDEQRGEHQHKLVPVDAVGPQRRQPRAHQTADKGMRGADRQRPEPGEHVPEQGTQHSGDHQMGGRVLGLDDPTDRAGDCDAHDQRAGEVEHGRDGDGGAGLERPGVDDRRDGVAAVVETVHQVEGEGDHNNGDERDGFLAQGQPLRSLDTSSAAAHAAEPQPELTARWFDSNGRTS